MPNQPNSTREMRVKSENLKNVFMDLDCIIPIIDKIGSGFEDTENLSLALVLFFKEKKVLDSLSKIRKYIDSELEEMLSEEDFDVFIESYDNTDFWSLPYDLSKAELLERIKAVP